MSAPIFEYNPNGLVNHNDAFSAAFLDQQSYIELLRIADSLFGLNMTSRDRILPCQINSYMVISRTPPQDTRYLWKGVGKKVSIAIDAMIYNEQYGVLAAIVRMKNNFTCNRNPHIVLGKSEGVNNILVSQVLDGNVPDNSASRVVRLNSPYRVHGKIGVILGSGEERINIDTKMVDGIPMRSTQNVVTRPEVVYTVEQPPPSPPPNTGKKFVTFEQFKQGRPRPKPSNDKDDIMEITLEDKSKSGDGVVATGETYQGEPVMQGPRGGKFITKDGKKKYVPAGKGGGKSDVVYNVNILE